MRRVPDFLPVGLQDFLRRSKSGLREEELMIHQYKLNGYNIVLDVNSGSVHVVDDVAYDIIQLFCGEIEEAAVPNGVEKARTPGRKWRRSELSIRF